MWHPWSPLVIQPSGLNSVLRLLCVVNHVLLKNWFAATSCKSCQSCFRCFQSLFFQGFFGFVVKLIGDQAAEAPRTTRSGSYWLTCLDATQGHRSREHMPNLVMQAGRIVRQSGSTRKQRRVIPGSQLKCGFVDCCFWGRSVPRCGTSLIAQLAFVVKSVAASSVFNLDTAISPKKF